MLKKIAGLVLVLGMVWLAAFPVCAQVADKMEIVKFGESIEVPVGTEVKSAVAIGGSVTVAGSVQEDAVAIGGSVYLKDRAVVGGDAVAIGGKVEKSPRAIVRGDIVSLTFPVVGSAAGAITQGEAVKGWMFFRVLSFIGFLVLVIILVAFFPSQVARVSSTVEDNLLRTFLFGLLGALLVVPIVVLLAISLVGIILIPVWIILVWAAGLFGYAGAAHYLGKKVLKTFKLNPKNMVYEALAGVVVLAAVGLLPFVGFIVKGIAGTMGLGAVILTRFGTQKA